MLREHRFHISWLYDNAVIDAVIDRVPDTMAKCFIQQLEDQLTPKKSHVSTRLIVW